MFVGFAANCFYFNGHTMIGTNTLDPVLIIKICLKIDIRVDRFAIHF